MRTLTAIAAAAACGLTLACASGASGQNLQPPNTMPPEAQLDALAAAHDWNGLGSALSGVVAGEPLIEKAEWLQSRIDAGGSSFLGFLAVPLLWRLGTEVGEDDPNGDFRIEAATLTLYTYELILIDGAVCEDSSAPEHRRDQLFTGDGGAALRYLKTKSPQVRGQVVAEALALEKKTAAIRSAPDDILCRSGMAEIKAGLDAGAPEHELPRTGFGRNVAVESPPGWTPKYLTPKQYEPIQAVARASMELTLKTLVQP